MVRGPASSRSPTARGNLGVRFVSDAIGELRRVTWPTRQETFRLTWMVIIIAGAIGLFLGLVDVGFSRLFEVVLGR